MCLFRKTRETKERKKLKNKIDKLMDSYSKEKIDGETYFKKMMNLANLHQKKRKNKK